MTSWHLAEQRDAFTAPTHSNVALGMWLRICALLAKQALEVWRSLVLAKEPALWKVDLRFRRTKAIVVVSVFGCYLCTCRSCANVFKATCNKGCKLRLVCELRIVRLETREKQATA